MIDSGSLYNLVSQRLIDKHGIAGDKKDILPAQDLNGSRIHLYKKHSVAVEAQKHNHTAIFDPVKMFGANIIGCNLILRLPWLVTADFTIKWIKSTVLFTNNALKPITRKAVTI